VKERVRAESPRGLVAVLVTYRSESHIRGCLEALAPQLGEGDHIVVVDNASPDDTIEAVERVVATLRTGPVTTAVLRSETNLGFGVACNLGAGAVPGLDVLLLNPDTEIQPGAVSNLRAALAVDGVRGAAGPRIDRFTGEPEPGCRRSLPRPGVAIGRLTRLDRVFPRRFGAYNRRTDDPSLAADIEAGSGCCVLVRREAWEQIGGFDPRFFMYGEDLDLFLRLARAGWVTRYEPAARVLHHKGASTDTIRVRMIFEFHRAMWTYYRKHHLRGAEALLAPFVVGGLAVRFAAVLVASSQRRLPARLRLRVAQVR
jgi:GT2 family glycosyltransferase